MTDSLPYFVQQSEFAKTSRKQLPRDTQLALHDVIDMLSEDPNAFPARQQPLDRSGRIRVYSHPSPPLQVTFEVAEEARAIYLLHFVAPQVQVTKPLFISYSHKDAAWLDKLKLFLRPLEDRGLVRVWDDTDIRPGSEWLKEIANSLETAQVAVFLVTQHFLNSEFIREKEMPALLKRAENRGCVIFWIAVSWSTVADSDIGRFQAANDPSKPLDTLSEADQNRVLKEIYDRMKKEVERQYS